MEDSFSAEFGYKLELAGVVDVTKMGRVVRPAR